MKESGIIDDEIPKVVETASIEDAAMYAEVADIATDNKTKEKKLEIFPRSRFHALMQKWGLAKKERTYTIRRLRVNNSILISALAQKIPDNLEVGSFLKFAIDNTHIYGDILIESCAMAIQNDRNPPSQKILDVVRFDFEWADVEEVLEFAMPQVANSFLNSIVLVKGSTEVLRPKASPAD